MTGFPSSVRFRHVVFADAARQARQLIDFTPRMLVPPMSGCDGESTAAAGVDHADEAFLRWLFLRVGLDVRMYRMETLSRRLSACLRVLRCANTHEARQLLSRGEPALISCAVSTLVIGVTSFFRDAGVFARLDDEILPELCGQGRRRGLRIWSIGCSDGQELYSIAMLLAERRVLHACHLLGTDCRADAVGRMCQGVYDPSAVRAVPAEMLRRYFVPHHLGWQVVPGVRSAIHARVANALSVSDESESCWDLIVCRNMAMYLQPDSATALWRALTRALRIGGVLMLGKAERPAGIKGLSYVGPCLYKREHASDC